MSRSIRKRLLLGRDTCIGAGIYVTARLNRDQDGHETLSVCAGGLEHTFAATGIALGGAFDLTALPGKTLRCRHRETHYDDKGRISAVVVEFL